MKRALVAFITFFCPVYGVFYAGTLMAIHQWRYAPSVPAPVVYAMNVSVLLTPLWIVCCWVVAILYIVLAARNTLLSAGGKVGWGVGSLLGAVIVCPVYWFVHLKKRPVVGSVATRGEKVTWWMIALILSALVLAGTALPGLKEKYQEDADLFRLRHLVYYGNLIEEYHAKTGHYPLQGMSQNPYYVHLAAPHQMKYVKGGPRYAHDVMDVESFRRVLEEGLGRKVALKFDPQKVPTGAPIFYIYMIEDEAFHFAVHLHHRYDFVAPVGRNYNKVEITNVPSDRVGLWQFKSLMEDHDFKTALARKPRNNARFLQLEEIYK